MTDPIADMLTRIRNAITENKEGVEIPASNEKKAIAKICYEEKVSRKQAKAIYEKRIEEAMAKKAEEEAKAAEEAAIAAAQAEEKANANTRLLEEIRDLLKNK